jgi:hypothetical protein
MPRDYNPRASGGRRSDQPTQAAPRYSGGGRQGYTPATSRASGAGQGTRAGVVVREDYARGRAPAYQSATSRASGAGRTSYNIIHRPGGVLDPRDYPNRTGQVGYTPATSFAAGAARGGGVPQYQQGYTPATSRAAGVGTGRRGVIVTEQYGRPFGDRLGAGFVQGVLNEREERARIRALLSDPDFMARINRRPPRQNYNFGGPGTNAYEPPLAQAPEYTGGGDYGYSDYGGYGGYGDGGWGGGGGGGGGGWGGGQFDPWAYGLTNWRV